MRDIATNISVIMTAGLIVVRGVPGDGSTVAITSMMLGAAMQIVGVAVVFAMASRSVS